MLYRSMRPYKAYLFFRERRHDRFLRLTSPQAALVEVERTHSENARVPPKLPDVSSTLKRAAKDAAEDAQKDTRASEVADVVCKLNATKLTPST